MEGHSALVGSQIGVVEYPRCKGGSRGKKQRYVVAFVTDCAIRTSHMIMIMFQLFLYMASHSCIPLYLVYF